MNEIQALLMGNQRKMCRRCVEFARDSKRPGELVLKGRLTSCRCEKQCSRLIEGICADCGHYVRGGGP